jgi:hypothetical protein
MINNINSGDYKMKSFKTYMTESQQKFKWKIKMAQEPTDDQVDRIERHLVKYDVQKFSAPKKLMLQSSPIDFPNLRGYEIYVMEFETNIVASGFQIQVEIQNMLGLNDGMLKVRGAHEPDEHEEANEGSLLADDTYSETDKVSGEDFYGDKYNTSFVQELLKLRKDKEKNDE